MNKTLIEWVKNPDGTQGYTWNPITGCLNGCSYCYARRLANGRLRDRYLANKNTAPRKIITRILPRYYPFYPRFWEDRLYELDPTMKGKHFTVGGASKVQPKGIFVCDMSDLFGIGIPKEWTRRVLDVIRMNHGHRFYLLTKQPQNLIKFSPFPDNCWVGVTATTTKDALLACYALQDIEAPVKYLSIEPLLAWVVSREGAESPAMYQEIKDAGINWLIIGAQTKPYKPPKIEHVEEIVRAADKAGIPVFLKDNLRGLEALAMITGQTHLLKEVFPVPILRQELPE